MESTLRHALLVLLVPALATATVAACTGSASQVAAETPDGGDPGSVMPPGIDPGQDPGGPTGPAGSGLGTGLPCDVQGIIENRCIACHAASVPPTLLRYEDLIAKSQKDPARTMAEVAVEEMKAKRMPPAPAAPPEEDEILAFEEWVKGGTKKNSVSCTDPPPDAGGASMDAGVDAGDGGVRCTSGKVWAQGNQGSESMHPGVACNACHQVSGGPNHRVAGTVYPTLHEPNDCNGSAPPPRLTVTVTDSRRPFPRTVTMEVNAAGNFFTRERLTPPLRARVSDGTKTRAMVGTVNSGDCNSCHTVLGANNAPGRIMAP